MHKLHEGLPYGSHSFTAQERVVHGVPAGAAVRAEAQRLGAKRVFTISGRSLAALADGPLQKLVAALGPLHAGGYSAVRAHSPREDVIAAADAARECGADLLVGVGGGSAIDAAKAVQMCLWMGLRTPAEMDPYREAAPPEIARVIDVPARPVRMLAVSTTLSASEFTGMCGITESASHAKQRFVHRLMVPISAVLDPAATLDTPRDLLFSTAIRSVDHAVETWCSPQATPATEAASLQGLRLLARALPEIARDPLDLQPRLTAQFGMWQACTPLAAGVQTGASHGIGYALGAGFNVGHGHTSCVMLPAVLRWNAAVNSERQRGLSEAMGAPQRPAHELIAELIAALGQPGNLRAVGIRREQLDELAQRALVYPPVLANPRPINSVADVREILELAW